MKEASSEPAGIRVWRDLIQVGISLSYVKLCIPFTNYNKRLKPYDVFPFNYLLLGQLYKILCNSRGAHNNHTFYLSCKYCLLRSSPLTYVHCSGHLSFIPLLGIFCASLLIPAVLYRGHPGLFSDVLFDWLGGREPPLSFNPKWTAQEQAHFMER